MSRCINNIDKSIFICNCSIFREDRDTSFTRQIIGIHYASRNLLVLAKNPRLGKQSINQDLARATTSQPISESAEKITESKDSALGIEVGMSMKEAEKKLIFETLRETGGNRTKAAKILGISIRTLRNKLNEYRAEGEDIEVEAEN